jgi:hypothetical protein
MPLSKPVQRDLLHLRDIALRGYRRADGLIEVEARLTDSKTHSFGNNDRGGIAAGEALHGMAVRVTVDDHMIIIACEATTDHAPFDICPGGAQSFTRLAGLAIKPGFLKAANERIGGTAGCTHLRELLQQVATVALQTRYSLLMRREAEEQAQASAAGDIPRRRRLTGAAALIDTCYAYASDSAVVQRQWPELYTGPSAGD